VPEKNDDERPFTKTAGKLTLTTPDDREVMMTRVFEAPRRLVFEALTRPELLKQWFLGPDGWSLPVCEIDLKAGGAYRYVWRQDEGGREMSVSGTYHEISPPDHFSATEAFHDPWYKGEALVTYRLTENSGRTTLTLTILYESREVRDSVLKIPMEKGVAASYDRLEKLLASAAALVAESSATKS
jgi:uncharacterized protein YndB with AHSA1/START domain